MAYGALSVLVTATAVPAGGQRVTVYNNGTAAVYHGTDSSVTTVTGVPIQPGGNAVFYAAGCYLIASATTDCRWTTGL